MDTLLIWTFRSVPKNSTDATVVDEDVWALMPRVRALHSLKEVGSTGRKLESDVVAWKPFLLDRYVRAS